MYQVARRSNQQRSDDTRCALIAAARELFIERSYAQTSTPEIVRKAGLTRGALYHHFADKQGLLEAVVAAESHLIAQAIRHSTELVADPIAALMKGGETFLDEMSLPGRTRMMLLEAPDVLGGSAADRIDAVGAGATVREGLQAAIDAGLIKDLPLEALAPLISGAFDRAALLVEWGVPGEACRSVLRAVIDGLRTDPPRP